MKSRNPAPLAAIQPPLDGPTARVLAAARRWRALAGAGLAARLPLVEVRSAAWVIGIPSPPWESELRRLQEQAADQGRPVPTLIGRLVQASRQLPEAQGPASPPAPGAGAAARLRWLMEQLSPQDGSR